MFRLHFKTAIRYFLKYRVYSIIHILGLAVGMAVFILIILFVQNEKRFDRFHQHFHRIYRIVSGNPGDKDSFCGTPAPLGPALHENIPSIDHMVRLSRSEVILRYEEKAFTESRFFLVDPSIFDIFSFTFIKGDPENALEDKNSIVITASMAEKYFGDENPMGHVIRLHDRVETDMLVTGVIEDVPEHSHFHFDFLVRFDRMTGYLQNWGAWNFYTYLLLRRGVSPESARERIVEWIQKRLPDNVNAENIFLQSLSHIHFQFNRYNLEPAFNGFYIVVFVFVALIVLLLACINFMNLSIARSSSRAREVGIKKTIGASRFPLIVQFLGESFIITFLAGLIALFIVELSLLWFNTFIQRQLNVEFFDPVFILSFLGLILVTALIAGGYPAFILSSFRITRVLKGDLRHRRGDTFRKILVIFQFSISIALIACMLVIHMQMTFIRRRDIGFNTGQIVNVKLNRILWRKAPELKEAFLTISGVQNASANDYVPSTMNRHHGVHWPGQTEDEHVGMWVIGVDKDFAETLHIRMLEGEDLSREFRATDRLAYLLNQSGRTAVGWETAQGKEFSIFRGGNYGTVVGVTEDFHFRSLHHEIGPCAMLVQEGGRQISLRLRSENIRSTITEIRKTWDAMAAPFEFDFYFLEDDLASLYRLENKLSTLIILFTMLSLIISCLGLFSLSSYTTLLKTKEIGIRKVLGASNIQVTFLLTTQFTRWVLIANVFAWPAAYMLIRAWLRNFAYRTQPNLWIFAVSGLLALFIALFTVSFQSLRAGNANPVDSLKYE